MWVDQKVPSLHWETIREATHKDDLCHMEQSYLLAEASM